MVKINFCPSCGSELSKGSFICPACDLDIEELFAKSYLLESNKNENSIELHDSEIGEVILDEGMSGDEIVIVVSENPNGDEITIDLDELGFDAGNMAEDVNIVVQIEGIPDAEDLYVNGEVVFDEASEWHYDDDPYGIVYYEFPKLD